MTDPRQLALEEEMRSHSVAVAMRRYEKSLSRDAADETVAGSRLLRASLELVAKGVQEWIDEVTNGSPSHFPKAARPVADLGVEAAAALGIKGVLCGIAGRRSLTRAAASIGAMVEDELRARAFAEQKPKEYSTAAKVVARGVTYRHRATVSRLLANREGVEHEGWSDNLRIHVGTRLIEIVITTTGLAEISRGPRSSYMLVGTDRTLEWMRSCTEWSALLAPEFWPMVAPPKPWVTTKGGGYYSLARPLPLIKTRERSLLEELSNRDLSCVTDALNLVQETPYRIDEQSLALIEAVWERGVTVGGLPPREPLPVPPKPDDIEENEAARKDWRKRAAIVHHENVRLMSKRVQLSQILRLARRFAAERTIYLPHQLDFRGRMYAVPVLSYQGADPVRSLLRFAEGKPVDDAVAAGWLMIQGANLYGVDKVSLDARMAWVEEHEEEIFRAAEDPLSDYWWAEADSPFLFAQWCREWAAFRSHGYGYVSSFICTADGTCNGLQHYSAMLRDAVGGAATNLVPSPEPADIYGRVAEVAVSRLRQIAASEAGRRGSPVPPFSDQEWAQRWLAFGVDRKITKRSVMTLPYGSTQYSSRSFVEEAVRERLGGDPAKSPFSHEMAEEQWSNGAFGAALWLNTVIWDAIGDVVVSAREAMGYLRGVAKALAHQGLPVVWYTPDGFPVMQAYREQEVSRLNLSVAGVTLRLRMRRETAKLSKRLQEQGLPPNYVHSLDAAALREYVRTASANRIRSFALVHDSYGCVAADYEMMQACIRDSFARMYEEVDPLATLHAEVRELIPPDAEVQLPALPAKGTLDIDEVRRSDFFFS